MIHGAEDRFVPVANARALADALPDSTLRVFDGAGHLVFIEKAAQVNRQISLFLKPPRPKKTRRKPRGQQGRISRAMRSLTGKLLGGLHR